jgi:hypothetical protein
VGCVAVPKPSRQGGRVRSRRPYGGSRALLSREVGSRAMMHVMAPEPSLAGRWVWRRWTHGSVGAHLGKEAGSSAAGHVAACGWTLHSLS